MEISNLPDKEFKVMVIKMLTNSGGKWMNTMKPVYEDGYKFKVI